MPFISKDWRSPGEEWVKTEEGWEKKKVLECSSQFPNKRLAEITNFSNSDGNSSNDWSNNKEEVKTEDGNKVPPHCHITIKCTKEIAGFNALSEAVRRLDFTSAVRDVRRFNYICALIRLLMSGQGLTALPGNAQKILLTMLEEIAIQVLESQQNMGALRALVTLLASVCEAERGACWGRPLGSKALWRKHDHIIERIYNIANNAAKYQCDPKVEPKLDQMPEECIREILLRIADHKDLETCANAWSVMTGVCNENRIWRDLVRFHFTQLQIEAAMKDKENVNWKKLYHTLRKTHGLREDIEYAEMLSLCLHCTCLYWRSLGHPCIADQCPEYKERLKSSGGPLDPRPVPPDAFLKFFSL